MTFTFCTLQCLTIHSNYESFLQKQVIVLKNKNLADSAKKKKKKKNPGSQESQVLSSP